MKCVPFAIPLGVLFYFLQILVIFGMKEVILYYIFLEIFYVSGTLL